MNKPDTLTIDGLPQLTWERKSGWHCDALLPAWAGFTPGGDPPTTGDVSVSFDCPDIYARTPPSVAQVAAFHRLIVDGEAIRDAILVAAFGEYQDWLGEEDAIAEELGGPLVSVAQLVRLIALNIVNITHEQVGGEATADLDFDCVWDHEHGFMASVTGIEVTYVGLR